ncbi:MAG: acyl--CoA ligase [Clostridia bacterium]|nr:acyl--CoA ligase [Clostridia bacterium]
MKKTTFYEQFQTAAEQIPDKIFLFDEKNRFTFAEAKAAVGGIASVFETAGVKRGDFVVLRAMRAVNTAIVFFALEALGAITVLTDPNLPVEEVKTNLPDCLKTDFAVTSEYGGKWTLFDGAMTGICDIDVSKCKNAYYVERSLPGDMAVIIFTTGSTGDAKAVCLTQFGCINTSEDTANLGMYSADDVAIELLPLHHVFGLSLVITALVNRHAVFIPSRTETDYIAECISRYGVTRMNGVPTLYLSLAERASRFDLSSLRAGLIGGGVSTREQFEKIEKTLDMTLIPVYGMSECMGISCGDYRDGADKRSACVGKFYPRNEGVVTDENGNELSIGIEGEIRVQSPSVMLGYFGADREKQPFDENGRLMTGDLGYVDDDGYLHITGRKKDIIIRGGENISCARIERAVMSLSGVKAAVAVGISDVKYGEVPCVMVVLGDGLEKTNRAEFENELKKILTKKEYPKITAMVKELPLASSGKPDKMKIKQILTEWKA